MSTTVIRNLNTEIRNPVLKPIYIPFNAGNGLLAAFRGAFNTDLSGNGNTTTLVGAPSFTEFGVTCDKLNGLLTSVIDRENITIVAVYRQPTTVPSPGQCYAYPAGNLAQDTTAHGIGVGLLHTSAVSLDLLTSASNVGANNRTDDLLGQGKSAARPHAAALKWNYVALSLNGSANTANHYCPQASTSLVPFTLRPNGGIKRSLLENGQPSKMRIGCWRDASAPNAASSTLEIAEVLFFDHALNKAELDQDYLYRKAYLNALGQDLIAD